MNKQLFEKQSNSYKPIYPLVRLEDIIDTISDKSIQWILNNYNHIYVEYSESVAITRNKVPQLLRRTGIWISYNAGTEVVTEYYKGDNKDVTNFIKWTDDDNWERFDKIKHLDGSITYQHLSESLKQLIGQGNNITNFPDDEDLEVKDGLLKLKDRDFEPNNFSGLGRVILRKNIKIVNGQPKNILIQDMINKSNTIYEIRYDFDLNGEEITIPEGCVLDFQGGSLSNGAIVGNNTTIKYNEAPIFDNINIDGVFNLSIFNINMWKHDNDITNVLKILSIYGNSAHKNDGTVIEIPVGEYLITETIELSTCTSIRCTLGKVVITCNVPEGSPAFHCYRSMYKNDDSLDATKWIDGGPIGLTLQGGCKQSYIEASSINRIGIMIGRDEAWDDATWGYVADRIFTGITIVYFKTGLFYNRWGTFMVSHTFLTTYGCDTAIEVLHGDNINSGENLNFYGCNFLDGNDTLMKVNSTFYFNFIHCGFDYYKRLLDCSNNWCYPSILINGCNFEGMNGARYSDFDDTKSIVTGTFGQTMTDKTRGTLSIINSVFIGEKGVYFSDTDWHITLINNKFVMPSIIELDKNIVGKNVLVTSNSNFGVTNGNSGPIVLNDKNIIKSGGIIQSSFEASISNALDKNRLFKDYILTNNPNNKQIDTCSFNERKCIRINNNNTGRLDISYTKLIKYNKNEKIQVIPIIGCGELSPGSVFININKNYLKYDGTIISNKRSTLALDRNQYNLDYLVKYKNKLIIPLGDTVDDFVDINEECKYISISISIYTDSPGSYYYLNDIWITNNMDTPIEVIDINSVACGAIEPVMEPVVHLLKNDLRFKSHTGKYYKNGIVSPIQYGANGDGISNDTNPLIWAINSNKIVNFDDYQYKITSYVYYKDCVVIGSINNTFIYEGNNTPPEQVIDSIKIIDSMTVYNNTTKKPMFWDGSKWIYSNGTSRGYIDVGSTIKRPSNGLLIGCVYFDTTLNKPIWWTGEKWVDATGADV